MKLAKKRGVGMATVFYGTGYGNGFPDVSQAYVELSPRGTATVRTAAVDCGQGSSTVFAIIAAEVLGLQVADIMVMAADTDTTPDTGTTAATRQTYNTGNAVRLASLEALRPLLLLAQQKLGVNTVEGLTVRDGHIEIKHYPEQRIKFSELVLMAEELGVLKRGEATFIAHTTSLDPETGQGAPYWPYAFATHIAEVEVNTETGSVEVLKMVAAHDVGRAINCAGVEGQIEGALAQGLGFALMEEVALVNGQMQNASFAKYIIPTAMDVPTVQAIIVQVQEPSGPFGAKGVGEPALIPVAPAILNAIYDAVGVRMTSLPVTAEKVLSALHSAVRTA